MSWVMPCVPPTLGYCKLTAPLFWTAIVGTAGELTLKRVRKGAEFAAHAVTQGPPPEQNIRINVPSKTQLYLDQTQRERDNAVTMHRAFQRDLYLLQLNIGTLLPCLLAASTVAVELAQTSLPLGVQLAAMYKPSTRRWPPMLSSKTSSCRCAWEGKAEVCLGMEGVFVQASVCVFQPHQLPPSQCCSGGSTGARHWSSVQAQRYHPGMLLLPIGQAGWSYQSKPGLAPSLLPMPFMICMHAWPRGTLCKRSA